MLVESKSASSLICCSEKSSTDWFMKDDIEPFFMYSKLMSGILKSFFLVTLILGNVFSSMDPAIYSKKSYFKSPGEGTELGGEIDWLSFVEANGLYAFSMIVSND